MISLNQVKNDLNQIKSYLYTKYDVESIYIFGSYAREEQTEKSDIDILVDFKHTPDLLTFIEIEDYISQKLKTHVDLVPKRKLKLQIKDQILQEAIAV